MTNWSKAQKILALASSDNDQEAIAAFMIFKRWCKDNNVDWLDVTARLTCDVSELQQLVAQQAVEIQELRSKVLENELTPMPTEEETDFSTLVECAFSTTDWRNAFCKHFSVSMEQLDFWISNSKSIPREIMVQVFHLYNNPI